MTLLTLTSFHFMQAAVGGAAPHLEPASSSSPLRYGPSLAADELCEARAAPQSYLGLMPSEVFATVRHPSYPRLPRHQICDTQIPSAVAGALTFSFASISFRI